MNSLKKALTKDDPKKYQKSKIQISGLKRTSNWQDIDSMIEKKIQRKNSDLTLEEAFKKIIQNHFVNGELKDIAKLLKQLKEKYSEQIITEVSGDTIAKILSVLKKAALNQESAVFKKCILLSMQKIERFMKQKKVKENQKSLQQYNMLFKSINPNSKAQDKAAAEGQKALKKLMHSTSAANLKIRLTREQYLLQEDEHRLKKKKSLDLKNHSKAHSNSHKNLDGGNKLQAFLKESNMKLVKTKIQYDYSAIFEASKSNIQSRNKTTYQQPKNQKQIFTKATKGKKDQAFVFYRPQKKH